MAYIKDRADGKQQELREDGYVNLLNNYGTAQDNSTAYRYQSEGIIPDMVLTQHYEQNGLFSKIIDAPAEEAVKHGFSAGLQSPEDEELLADALDALDWEAKAATAIKWSRLYGGAITVMLINDGGGLEDPLNLKKIKGIDELRVYERAIVQPDPTATFYGEPQYYQVCSLRGYFIVHKSRCLVFKNGILPERTMDGQLRYWGMPEYQRIRNELRECATAHGNGAKLLDRAVQAIYSMKNLSNLIMTDEGEAKVLKRLQMIDEARGMLNSLAIDSEGENYDFKSISFAGVKEVIDSSCNMLSAVTNIPQTILFGRSPSGMNATGTSDLENYYNLIERIQRLQIRGNLKTLIDVIFRAALAKGKIADNPKYRIEFNPLWNLSDTERAAVDQTKAATAQTRAQTAQIYVDMGALDPSEVRKGLADDNEFDIEKLLDNLPEDDLMAGFESEQIIEEEPLQENTAPEQPKSPGVVINNDDGVDTKNGVGVIVLKGDAVLCGKRTDNGQICGPGGHVKQGESPSQAAIRETQEEFGITPINLKRIGRLESQPGKPWIFLCAEFEGEPRGSDEIKNPAFFPMDEFEPEDIELFPPFAESLKLLDSGTRNSMFKEL